MDQEEGYNSSPITKFYDADGNDIKSNSASSMKEGNSKFMFQHDIGKRDGIIKAELSSYPNWIEEEVRIKIK